MLIGCHHTRVRGHGVYLGKAAGLEVDLIEPHALAYRLITSGSIPVRIGARPSR
jgi:hypothetical protein